MAVTVAGVRVPAEFTRQPTGGGHVAGPFIVLGQAFVIESPDDDFITAATDSLVDLAGEPNAVDPTVYQVEQVGPDWQPHPWAVWRDGERLGAEVGKDFLPGLIASDFTRHATGETATRFALIGMALARRDRAVALVVDHARPGEVHGFEPLDLAPPAVRSMAKGWAPVAIDVVPIDVTTRAPVVLPFHRPIVTSPDGPPTAISGRVNPTGVVAVSRFGPPAGATTLSAFVVVRASEAGSTRLEPVAPPQLLRPLAVQLLGGVETRRRSFRQLAELVGQVTGFVLDVGTGDADGAARAIGGLW